MAAKFYGIAPFLCSSIRKMGCQLHVASHWSVGVSAIRTVLICLSSHWVWPKTSHSKKTHPAYFSFVWMRSNHTPTKVLHPWPELRYATRYFYAYTCSSNIRPFYTAKHIKGIENWNWGDQTDLADRFWISTVRRHALYGMSYMVATDHN